MFPLFTTLPPLFWVSVLVTFSHQHLNSGVGSHVLPFYTKEERHSTPPIPSFLVAFHCLHVEVNKKLPGGILPAWVSSKSTVVPPLPLPEWIHVRLWRALCYVNSQGPKIVHPLCLSSTDGGSRGVSLFFFLGYRQLLVAPSSRTSALCCFPPVRSWRCCSL